MRLRVRAVEDLAPVAALVHEADFVKHLEVLGDRRLRQAQAHDDVADGALARSEVLQDVPAARLRHGAEGVRGREGGRHGLHHIPI